MAKFSLEDIGLEDYIQAKRDSVIASALEKSRTRVMPEVISYRRFPTDDERKKCFK